MTALNGHAIEVESVETPTGWASEMLMMGLRLKAGVDLDLIERKCGPRQLWLDLDRLATSSQCRAGAVYSVSE